LTDAGEILIVNLLSIFTKNEKFELFGILLLSLGIAVLETIGIGSIFPFISMVSKPEIIHENQWLNQIYEFFPFQSEREFITFSGLFWIAVVIFKNGFNALAIYIQNTYFLNKGANYSALLFESYLQRNYTFHLKYHSATLRENIFDVDRVFIGILIPLFNIISEILVILGIISLLLYSNFWLTINAILLVGLPSWIISYITGNKLTKLGKKYHLGCRKVGKVMLEGLNNIKEIKVMNRELFFSGEYFLHHSRLSGVRVKQIFLSNSPRLFIEVIVFVSVVAFILLKMNLYQDTFLEFIPIMALFCIAVWRLLGALNRIVQGRNQLNFILYSANLIFEDLQQIKNYQVSKTNSLILPSKIDFDHKIELNNVSFTYDGVQEKAVNKISLNISKGESIAFVGATGAGKTTLVDVILGLLTPEEGKVLVDDINIQEKLRNWKACIGYIPQLIHLSDDTLRRNIAFGIHDEHIDEKIVLNAVEAAQLQSFVENLPNGLDTIIGEQGNRLSGGQRQRIAIARALYHDPEVLIMDEATSALDGETESDLIKAIDELSGRKTLIIIAHRLTTIRNCDRIYVIENTEIKDMGTFDELLETNSQFRRMAGFGENNHGEFKKK
jgi:ATP-binding cassette, subfamily B, bacterial PglK